MANENVEGFVDEERIGFDPASLLPFERVLDPSEPSVERIPRRDGLRKGETKGYWDQGAQNS